MKDSYLTISTTGNGLFKDRGSKFLGFAVPVESETAAREVLDTYRKEYHDARHHCFAWRLHPDYSVSRANDDGEPGNSAGKPILNQIDVRGLTNTLVVVVRYFGGTKLGVSGLINAYRSAAADALNQAGSVRRYITVAFRLKFPYEAMNEVMRLTAEDSVEITGQDFGESCTLVVRTRKGHAASFTKKVRLINDCTIENQFKFKTNET